MNARFLLLSAALLATTVAGCGGETQVPVFPVKGKVTFQGAAPSGAQVVLTPVGEGVKDVTPTGTVKEDGTFSITSYQTDDGAPAGEYKATVVWFKIVESEGGRGPNVLPEKYASAATSDIKISVSGPTDVPPLDLTK